MRLKNCVYIVAPTHVETIVSIQKKNSQKSFILGTLRSISCSLRRVKKSEISTSKTTLTFRWQLISGVGTQTENKGFGQSTCLCSVHPADKIQATGSQKLNGISVSLEIVVRLFFRSFASLNILVSVYIIKAKRTVKFMRRKKTPVTQPCRIKKSAHTARQIYRLR